MEILETALQPIVEVVEKLRSTSGSNDKIKILKENKDAPHLQEILKLTYDPFMKYGVSKTMVEKLENSNVNRIAFTTYENFIDFMNRLAKSNINDALRVEIAEMLHHPMNQAAVDLLKCILTKDLKIGMAAANINKAIPELIPVFDVMRGQKYADHKHKLKGKEIIITEKIDGVRTVAIIDGDGNIKFYSRQGKELEGLVEIEAAIKLMNLKSIVLDGETTIFDSEELDNKEVYKRTMEIIGSKLEQKTGLLYNIFDCMPLSAFKAGLCKTSARSRKSYFGEKYYNTKDSVNNQTRELLNHIRPLPVLYDGIFDEEVVDILFEKVIDRHGEGLMINLAVAPYECKRTQKLLKVKNIQSCDLRVVGFAEGEVGGKYHGTLGALVVDYKGYRLDVGSGFTDEERNYYWTHQEEILGRVIEVEHHGETYDKKGDLSLRHGIFAGLREVGKEVSYD